MNATLAMLTGPEMAIAAGAAFLPFLLSFIAALRPKAKPRGVDDYFLYKRELDTGTFATGSVGYSMQVASIYLFLYWWQLYGLWSLWVPFAWLGGYFLQGAWVRSKKLDAFLASDSAHIATIHGYIGANLGAKRALVWVLAFTTIVGFGGTMLGEIDYALTYFVLPGIGVSVDALASKITLFLIIFVAAGSYIMWGGYRAAIDTDTTQVKAAFFLFAVILGAFAVGAAKMGHSAVAVVVCVGLIVFSAVAIISRKQLQKADEEYRKMRNDYYKDVALFSGMIVVAIVSIVGVYRVGVAPTANTPNVTAITSTEKWGFGIPGLIALVITNALWQFLDVSSLQRLQSLRFDPNKKDDREKVSGGLRSAGWEGTGSWFMVIGFAVLLKACGLETTAPHLGMMGNIWLLSAFLYVVVAFMLSTLDTLVAASAYVVHYDYTHHFLAADAKDNDARELRLARRSTMFALLLTSVIYFGIKYIVRDDALRQSSIIYAIYAIQAAIFGPVVVSVIWPKRSSVFFAFVAIGGGWAVAWLSATSSNPWFGMSLDSWYVMPPFAALTVSFAASGFGALLTRRRQ